MTAFYTYASQHKSGGGALGGLICKVLTGAFGVVGAWIIVAALFIICAVVITERSFIGGVKTGSRKVYDSAKEDARRYRIQAEERREARRKAMEERAALEEEEREGEEAEALEQPVKKLREPSAPVWIIRCPVLRWRRLHSKRQRQRKAWRAWKLNRQSRKLP